MIGIPDDYRGEAAKAFVKLRDGAKPFTLDELRAFLTGKIGRHELPAALELRRRAAAHGGWQIVASRIAHAAGCTEATAGSGRPGVMETFAQDDEA